MALFSLLPLIGISIFVQARCRLTASTSLLVSVAGWTLVVYIAALAGLLEPVTTLSWFAAGALGIYSLSSLNPLHNAVRINLLSAPYIALLFGALVFWLLHRNSVFIFYDEFSHWGVYIREMWAQKTLWGIETNAVRPRYLPGAVIFQYAFTVPAQFSEGSAYLAQFILLVVPLLVLLDTINRERLLWIPLVIVLLVVSVVNYSHGFVSLYVDHIVAVWVFGIAMILIDERSPKTFLKRFAVLALPLTMLAMIKASAIFFVLFIAFTASLLFTMGNGQRRNVGEAGGLFLLLIALPLLAIFLWNVNRDAISAHAYSPTNCLESCRQAELNASEPIGEILTDLVVQGLVASDRNHEVTRNFLKALTEHRLRKTAADLRSNEFLLGMLEPPDNVLGLTAIKMIIFYGLFMAGFLLWIRQRQALLGWGVVSALFLITALGYTASLWLAYLFFYEVAGEQIPSFVRFIHTVTLPMILFMVAFLVPGLGPDRLHERIKPTLAFTPAVLTATALILYLVVIETPYVGAQVETRDPSKRRVELEPVAQTMRQLLGKNRVLVLIPAPIRVGMRDQIIRYLLAPTPARFSFGTNLLELDDEQLAFELSRTDYVWLPEVLPTFDKKVEARVGRIGDLRLIRVTRDERLHFSPVDVPDQIEPREDNGRE